MEGTTKFRSRCVHTKPLQLSEVILKTFSRFVFGTAVCCTSAILFWYVVMDGSIEFHSFHELYNKQLFFHELLLRRSTNRLSIMIFG